VAADRWDDPPSQGSIKYLRQMLMDHTHVSGVSDRSANRYDIRLTDGNEVKIFVTDVYEFSVSDYALLRSRHPEVQCVLSASNWNHFTDASRQEAKADGVATFHFRELMGALNRRGDEFLNYRNTKR
jgi:hypothetical protein